MPYEKLVKIKKPTELQVKQARDDHRIFHAWWSSLQKGIRLKLKSGELVTEKLIAKRHSVIVNQLLDWQEKFGIPFNHQIVDDLDKTLPKETQQKVSTGSLIREHKKLHDTWQRIKESRSPPIKEEIWNKHKLLTEKMKKMGVSHKIVDKDLDSKQLPKFQDFQQIVNGLPEQIELAQSFIIGSVAEGKSSPSDLDLLIQPNRNLSQERNTQFEMFLVNELEKFISSDNLHFVYDPAGPHGINIPLYKITAVKTEEFSQRAPQYDFPLFSAAPKYYRTFGGVSVFIHKDYDTCQILSPEALSLDLEQIESEFSRMKVPEQFILEAELFSDMRLFIKDIWRWNSTELLHASKTDRAFFLKKIVWPDFCLFNKPILLEEKTIQIMKPFLPLKTRAGYGQYEFNKIENLIKFWAKGENLRIGIACEQKFDGFRLQIHKKDNKVAVFTEDLGRDRAQILPGMVKDVQKIPADELILDSETVWWKEDHPLPRHKMMAIIAGKKPLEDELIIANCFDCLWWNGKALQDLPWTERQTYLKKAIPKNSTYLHRVIPIICKSESELIVAFKKLSKIEGSEGMMAKVTNGKYPLAGRTPTWAKLKVVKEITLKVIGIRQKRVAGKPVKTYLYRGAFFSKHDAGPLMPMESQHILAPKDMDEEREWEMGLGFKRREPGEYGFGETYGTSVKAKIGDLITVSPIHILEFTGKDNKQHFAWMFPRFRNLETAVTKPDDIDEVRRIAGLAKSTSIPKEQVQETKVPQSIQLPLSEEDFPLSISIEEDS